MLCLLFLIVKSWLVVVCCLLFVMCGLFVIGVCLLMFVCSWSLFVVLFVCCALSLSVG